MFNVCWQAEEDERSQPGQQDGEAANECHGLLAEQRDFVRGVEIGQHQHREDGQPERSNKGGNQTRLCRGSFHPVRHGFDDDFLLPFPGLDLFGFQFDERLDEWGHFAILGQFLEGFLRKIDPRLAFREAADFQLDDQTVFIGRSEFPAQYVSVGEFEFLGGRYLSELPAQANGQPN